MILRYWLLSAMPLQTLPSEYRIDGTGCQEIDVPLLTKPYKFIIKTKKTMSLANVTSLNFDTFLNALGHTTNQVVKNIGRDVWPSRFHIFYQSFPVRRVR